MEPTVEQALQQGVAFHNSGKLQDAERIYREILQSQPAHPDANHNLGLIAVSFNRPGDALPLFKAALDANPNIEQFWLSYIDALIKENQLDAAKHALGESEKRGFSGTKFDTLDQTLDLALDGALPPQSNIGRLLEFHQSGEYGEAEALAKSIIERFPAHPFSWKVLGAVLRQTGKVSEALDANQKAATLSPRDAEVHYNLGVNLQDLGRLEEAEASYKQAISLNPDFAEAHNNLGNTLAQLSKRGAAEAHYIRAIELKPDYAEAHYNLGFFYYSAKAYGKALEQFNSTDFGRSKYYLLRCLFEQDEQSLFYDHLDSLIDKGEVHAMIGSLGYRSMLRYGVERHNLYCRDPLKYVFKKDLKSEYDFEEKFVKKIRAILDEDKIPSKSQDLLTNGYQSTGNLFQLESETTGEIQYIIRSELEKYKATFEDSEEGLIKKWPSDYRIFAWLIKMKSGGELGAHIHEQGWISGTVYINVPPKSNPDSGNLVVSIGEDRDVRGGRKNSQKTVDVETGNLVFFPASLMHHTIPFESQEERICIAFDVIPE